MKHCAQCLFVIVACLVVGLIAGVRRLLLVTAEAERSFRWNPQGIELLILIGLILAFQSAVPLASIPSPALR